MKNRIPLWLTILACSASALGGAFFLHGKPATAQAKDPKEPDISEYPYLPLRYGEPFIPSFAEWQAMRVTSLGASTTRLTQEFTRQHLTCFPTREGLVMTLDLIPQPEWKFYAGNGKFNAPAEKVTPDLLKAVDSTMRFVRNFYPEVRDQDVTIRLYLRSESIGQWHADKLELNK